jgi:hypothetical protein
MATRRLGGTIPRSRASALWAERFTEAANRDIRETSASRFSIWAQNTEEQQRASRFAPTVQPPSQEPTFFDQLGQTISDVPVLGGIWGAQGTALQWGMEQLGKPGAMVSGGILGLMDNSGGNSEDDFGVWEGIRRAWVGTEEERQDLNFATVLERGGVLAGEEHTWARNALGLVADIVIDPLNLLVIPGVASRMGKVGRLAQRAASPVTRPITRLTGGRENKLLRGLQDALSSRVGKQHRFATPQSQLDALERAGKIDSGQAHQLRTTAGITRVLETGADLPFSPAGRRALTKSQEELMGGLPELQKTSGWGPFKKTTYNWDEVDIEDKIDLMHLLEKANGDPLGWADPHLIVAMQGRPALTKMLNAFRDQYGGREIRFAEGLLPIGERGTPVTQKILRKDLGRYGEEQGISQEALREIGVEPFTETVEMFGAKTFMGLSKSHISVPVLTKGPVGRATADLEAHLGLASRHGMYVRRYMNDAERAAKAELPKPATSGQVRQWFSTKLLEKKGPPRSREELKDALLRGDSSADPLLVYTHDLAHTTAKIGWAEMLVDSQRGILRAVNGVVEVPKKLVDDLHRYEIDSPNGHKAREVYDDWLRKQTRTEGSPLFDKALSDYVHYDTLLPHLKSGEDFSSLPKAMQKRYSENRRFIGPKEVINIIESWSAPYETAGLFRHADAVQNLWKPLVTVLFPAYHVRNIIGLVHNNLMARVGIGSWYKGAKLMKGAYTDDAFNITEKGVKRWATPDALVEDLELANIIGAGTRYLSPSDIEAFLRLGEKTAGRNLLQKVSDTMQGRGELEGVVGEKTASLETWKALLRADIDGRWAATPLQKFNPIRMGASASEGIDNWGRISHVIGRLDQGDSFDDAVRSAKRYIFAYNEAPPSVQSLSTVLPFFRWTYFNVPLQAKEMLLRPYGAVRMTGYLTRTFEGIQGDQLTGAEALDAEAASLPDWVLERHHIVLGRNDDGTMNILYGMGLPTEDLNKLFALTPLNTIRNLLTEAGPLFKIPLELVTNTSVFADEPIEPGDDLFPFYSRAGKILADLPTPVGDSLRAFLEFDRRVDARTGKERLYANPTRMYLFGSIFGRIGMTVDRGWEAIEDRKWDNAFHLLSGVKYRPDLQPERAYHEPWQKVIREDPEMYNLYTQYKEIPLYRGLTAQQGNLAQSALIKIGKKKNMIMDYEPSFKRRERQAFNLAVQIIEETDPEGVHWALEVRRRRLRQNTRARDRFKSDHPAFASVMRGEPLDEVTRELRSVGIEPLGLR